MTSIDTWLVLPTANQRPYLNNIISNADIPFGQIVVIATNSESVPKVPPGVHLLVDENKEVNCSRWWNMGVDYARERGGRYIAIFNDDIDIEPNTIPSMAARMKETGRSMCFVTDVNQPDTRGHKIFTGWAFMIDSDYIHPDEQFRWYYGDTDMYMQARLSAHGVTHVRIRAQHLHPGQSTNENPERHNIAQTDQMLFYQKWKMLPDHFYAESVQYAFEQHYGEGTWDPDGIEELLATGG